MKTKALLLVGAVALVTLSFTFVSKGSDKSSLQSAPATIDQSAPVGGTLAGEIVR